MGDASEPGRKPTMTSEDLALVRRFMERNGLDRRGFLRLTAALGATAVGGSALLAACGDDDEDAADTSAAPASSEAPPATSEAAPASSEAAPSTEAPATSESAPTSEATAAESSAVASPVEGLEPRYGWMIAANAPFFELSMTRWMEKELEPTDFELSTQSEDGNAVKAQQIMSTMLADKFSGIAKADGVPPKPFEELAKQASDQGTLFQNHAVQAVGGAGQNIAFDHKVAGANIGNAAVEWAQANGIEKPIIGVLGNLEDPEGVKRTDVAVETVKAAFPNTVLAGEVNAVDQPEDGSKGAANLLAATPDINMILTFNTVSGKGAVQAANEAGKTDRTKFFIGMADSEPETTDLIAAGDSIVQANWGALFEISAVLLIRDFLKYVNGEPIQPTRAVGGRLLRTKEDVDAYRAIADDPTGDAALPAYDDPAIVQYSDTPLETGQSINDVLGN